MGSVKGPKEIMITNPERLMPVVTSKDNPAL